MNELIQKKQIKTVQNSHESSQHSGHNNLKIDIKKVDGNHKMGVTTIINSKDEQQSKDYSTVNGQKLNQSFSLRNMPAGDPHEVESLMMNKQIQQPKGCNEQASLYIMIDSKPRLIQQSQSQKLKKEDELESSFDDSMAQSITKKHPNFKLDLSKCKNDDEQFGEDF